MKVNVVPGGRVNRTAKNGRQSLQPRTSRQSGAKEKPDTCHSSELLSVSSGRPKRVRKSALDAEIYELSTNIRKARESRPRPCHTSSAVEYANSQRLLKKDGVVTAETMRQKRGTLLASTETPKRKSVSNCPASVKRALSSNLVKQSMPTGSRFKSPDGRTHSSWSDSPKAVVSLSQFETKSRERTGAIMERIVMKELRVNLTDVMLQKSQLKRLETESVSNTIRQQKSKNVKVEHIPGAEIREFRVLATSSTTEVVEDVAKTRNSRTCAGVCYRESEPSSKCMVETSLESEHQATVLDESQDKKVTCESGQGESHPVAKSPGQLADSTSSVESGDAIVKEEELRMGVPDNNVIDCSNMGRCDVSTTVKDCEKTVEESQCADEVEVQEDSTSLKDPVNLLAESSEVVFSVQFSDSSKSTDEATCDPPENSDMQLVHTPNIVSEVTEHTILQSNVHLCMKCQLKFPSQAELEAHKIHCDQSVQLQCDICRRYFSGQVALEQHRLTHKQEQTFSCVLCQRSFKDHRSLEKHRLIHTKESKHHCHICGQPFWIMRQMKQHIVEKHPGQKAFKCTKCESQFTELKALQFHQAVHTGEKAYKCELCEAAFAHPSTLKVHYRSHKNKKIYTCHVCQDSFFKQRGLLEHMSEHEGAKAFKCDVCGNQYDRMGTFKEHLKIHTGEKAFQCTHCGKMFARKDYLGRHMRIHTGAKPYSCDKCGRRFTFWAHLQQHTWEHEDRRPYKCSVCDAGFRRSDHLRDHMKLHTTTDNVRVPRKKVPRPMKAKKPVNDSMLDNGCAQEARSDSDLVASQIIIPSDLTQVVTENDPNLSEIELIARQVLNEGHLEADGGDVQIFVVDHGTYQEYVIKQEPDNMQAEDTQNIENIQEDSVYEITEAAPSTGPGISHVNTAFCRTDVRQNAVLTREIPGPNSTASEQLEVICAAALEQQEVCDTAAQVICSETPVDRSSVIQTVRTDSIVDEVASDADTLDTNCVYYTVSSEDQCVVGENGEAVYVQLEEGQSEEVTAEEHVGAVQLVETEPGMEDEVSVALQGLADHATLQNVPQQDHISSIYTYKDAAGETHMILVQEEEGSNALKDEPHTSVEESCEAEIPLEMTGEDNTVFSTVVGEMSTEQPVRTLVDEQLILPSASLLSSSVSPLKVSGSPLKVTGVSSITASGTQDYQSTSEYDGSHTALAVSQEIETEAVTILEEECVLDVDEARVLVELPAPELQNGGSLARSHSAACEDQQPVPVDVLAAWPEENGQVSSNMIAVEKTDTEIPHRYTVMADSVFVNTSASTNPQVASNIDLMQVASGDGNSVDSQHEIVVTHEIDESVVKIAENSCCVGSQNFQKEGVDLNPTHHSPQQHSHSLHCSSSEESASAVGGNGRTDESIAASKDGFDTSHGEVKHAGDQTINVGDVSDIDKPADRTDGVRLPVALDMLDVQCRCRACDKNFHETERLKQHMDQHFDLSSLLCRICMEIFDDTEGLQVHIREHTLIQTHLCLICSLSFSAPESLQAHVDSHKTTNQCPACPKKFKFSRSLQMHVNQHKKRKFVCDKCSRGFQTSNSLGRHMRLYCREFQCDVCGRKWSSADLLHRHEKLHLKKAKHACHICHKPFWKVVDLCSHMNEEHDGHKAFVCTVCGKEFGDQSSLAKHSATHTGFRPWMCELCGKVFVRSTSLAQHLKSHKKQKYRCHVCDAAVASVSALMNHMRLHPGRKPFKCKICSLEISHFSSLKLHLDSHANSKHHQCQVCGKQFARSVYLSLHMKNVHTETKTFPCPVCGRTFSKRQYVTQHVWTHTGERPFRCSQCPAGFTRSSHLNDHMATHSDRKPFQCTVCFKSFATTGNLQKHRKLHQNSLPP